MTSFEKDGDLLLREIAVIDEGDDIEEEPRVALVQDINNETIYVEKIFQEELIIEEYIPGQTLEELVRNRDFPMEEASKDWLAKRKKWMKRWVGKQK